jgi:antirestriction protein ArdC
VPTQTEIRADITVRLVEALKRGVVPWRKPWRGSEGPRLPTNVATGRAYSGLNLPLLWLAAREREYPVDLWASFQQLRSLGAHVRRGETATQVVFSRPVPRWGRGGRERGEAVPPLRTWKVFNVAQAEGGVAETYRRAAGRLTFDHSDRGEFDRAVAATGAVIRYGGEKALYHRPPLDSIRVPHEGRFEGFPAFAETVLHELLHWSEHRLGWAGGYAEGELRAEIGAAYLSAALNIPDSGDLTNHAVYLGRWLQALDAAPGFLFRAASAAAKGADYILSFSRPDLVAVERPAFA